MNFVVSFLLGDPANSPIDRFSVFYENGLALMTVLFDPGLGANNPFDAFSDRDFYDASFSIRKVTSSVVLPLPAGLELLTAGFGLPGAIGRRRNK